MVLSVAKNSVWKKTSALHRCYFSCSAVVFLSQKLDKRVCAGVWVCKYCVYLCVSLCKCISIWLIMVNNGFPKMYTLKDDEVTVFTLDVYQIILRLIFQFQHRKKYAFSLKSSTVWKLCKAGVYIPFILLFGFAFLNNRVNKFLFLLTLHCELDMQVFNCWVGWL